MRRLKKIISLLLLLFLTVGISCASEPIAEPETVSDLTVHQIHLYGDMEKMYEKKDVRHIEAMFVQDGTRIACYASIKVQGTSSLAYEKKNYTIRFYSDPAHDSELDVDFGWGAQNEYCLKANWIDNTHSRNVVTARLAAEVQAKYGVLEQAPCNGLIDGFPVEVYINDEFHGLYTCNIPKSAWMFGMDEDNPNHIVMCGENWNSPTLFYASPDFDCWSVEAGPENQETLDQFTRLADFIMNSSIKDFKENFHEYLDLDATLNYCILVDFAFLRDNTGKNMLMATYDGKIWYPSLYDLDTSWGTNYDGLELLDYENMMADFGEYNNLARRMEMIFPQELHDRYFELRSSILTKEHVMELFHDFDAAIPEDAKAKETERWGEDIPGYGFEQIEAYLDYMLERLDQKYSRRCVFHEADAH